MGAPVANRGTSSATTIHEPLAGKKRPIEEISDRCKVANCNRKLPLTATACKCGEVFCNRHSFFTDHNCTFDFHAHHQVLLQKKYTVKLVSSQGASSKDTAY